MRRSLFWCVVVLPVVLVVGHPVAVALFGAAWWAPPGSGYSTAGHKIDEYLVGGRMMGVEHRREPTLFRARVMRLHLAGDVWTNARALPAEPPVVWAPGASVLATPTSPPAGGGAGAVPTWGRSLATAGYGWPRVSAAIDADADNQLLLNGVEVGFLGRHRLGMTDVPRAVPTRVVWSGLLVNWLVVAGACASMVVVLRSATRARRRMRGACLACGYDVGDLERCPECGAPRPAGRSTRTA